MKTLLNSLSIIILAALFSCNNPGKNTTLATQPAVHDNGVNIAYTDSGKGDTTLLFVHGWLINGSYWSNQVNYFSKRYRVVTIDLPGFGQSGKNRNSWTVKDFGRDIDSVIVQLNLKNVILIGHSMAGDIMIEAAIHAPDKIISLVGIDNLLNVGQVQSAESKKAISGFTTALKKGFKATASAYFSQYLFYKTTDSLVKKKVLNDVAHADSAIAIPCIESILDAGADAATKLKATKKKLYLINSDIHETYTGGFKANGIPFELKEIHATGHFPMVEKPTEFNILLTAIIRDIKADGK